MLTTYRRHLKACPHRSNGQRQCRCPIWAHGVLRGEFVRKSLKTVNWETGLKLAREWETAGIERVQGMAVGEACDRFYADCVARSLRDATLGKYALMIKDLKREFRGMIGSVSLDELRELREGWECAPMTGKKRIDRLRAFFKFCQESGWIGSNPARLLTIPQLRMKPAVPFSESEMEKILWATEVYPDNPPGRRAQMRAFVLVLRYTGLRIGDAVALRRESINEGKLNLRTAKTGTAVWLPLKEEVMDALTEIRNPGDRFFWSGKGTLKSGISSWHRSMAALFKLAGVKGHPHQFRHYFSVELLSLGVPIEDVAILLGHSSSAITAKHYNAFVKSRQERLEANIMKAWRL